MTVYFNSKISFPWQATFWLSPSTSEAHQHSYFKRCGSPMIPGLNFHNIPSCLYFLDKQQNDFRYLKPQSFFFPNPEIKIDQHQGICPDLLLHSEGEWSLFSLTVSLLLTLVLVLKNKAAACRHAPAALNEGDISTVPSVYSALLCWPFSHDQTMSYHSWLPAFGRCCSKFFFLEKGIGCKKKKWDTSLLSKNLKSILMGYGWDWQFSESHSLSDLIQSYWMLILLIVVKCSDRTLSIFLIDSMTVWLRSRLITSL